jgi:hypothetical protein
MASVAFSGVFYAPAGDLSNTLYLDSMPTVTGGKQKPGELRRYAGGRVRLVTSSGQSQSASDSFEHISRADREWLESFVGELMLRRDGRGRCFYGAFLDLNVQEEQGWQELCTVSLTFNEITRSFAV